MNELSKSKRIRCENTIFSEDEIVKHIKGFDASANARVLRIADLIDKQLTTFRKGKRGSKNPLLVGAMASRWGGDELEDFRSVMASHDECAGLETSLGRLFEEITTVYGWSKVMSPSHSLLSEIDCMRVLGRRTTLACIKSGPLCINDTMANRIGTAIGEHMSDWIATYNTEKLEFVLGLSYGTHKQSNKKNWYAIRVAQRLLAQQDYNIIRSGLDEDTPKPFFLAETDNAQVLVRTEVGSGFWDVISRPVQNAFLEICCALTKVVRGSDPLSVKQWIMLFAESFMDPNIYVEAQR